MLISHSNSVVCRINRPLGFERGYLPLCKVADTPFHIQGDKIKRLKTAIDCSILKSMSSIAHISRSSSKTVGLCLSKDVFNHTTFKCVKMPVCLTALMHSSGSNLSYVCCYVCTW